MTLFGTSFPSPIGGLTVAVDRHGTVKHLQFGKFRPAEMLDDTKAIRPAREQLEQYFAGERRRFDLDLAPDGTAFQRAVWRGLMTIPYGETLSYGALAERVGYPGAFRAVGAANGANPIAIIMPCHRVVGSDGRLTGFGGGIPTKAALLVLEGVLPPEMGRAADRRTRVNPPSGPAQLGLL